MEGETSWRVANTGFVSTLFVHNFLEHSAWQRPAPLSGDHSQDLHYSLTPGMHLIILYNETVKWHWGVVCPGPTFELILFWSAVQSLSASSRLEEQTWGLSVFWIPWGFWLSLRPPTTLVPTSSTWSILSILWNALFSNRDQVLISRLIHSFCKYLCCFYLCQVHSALYGQDPYSHVISILEESQKTNTQGNRWQDHFREWQIQWRK